MQMRQGLQTAVTFIVTLNYVKKKKKNKTLDKTD